MANIPAALEHALKAAGFPVIGLSTGNPAVQSTWRVDATGLTPQQVVDANAFIQAFNPNDPALEAAELDDQVKAILDNERLISAVVWTILDTYSEFKPANLAKYQAARSKVVTFYKSQPWKP